MNEYVISNALKQNIYLSKDELQEIWAAEYEYLDMNGQIEDETPPEWN